MAMHRITDHIFLGSIYSLSPGNLANNNITYVLSVLSQPGIPTQSLGYLPSIKQKHLMIDIEDTEEDNIMQHFAATNEFIEEAVNSKQNILIHCIAGISRSATVTAAFLMRCNNWTSDQALEYIRERRKVANPNPSFREQLDVYYDCGYKITPDKAPYRRWLLKMHSEDAQMNKVAPAPEKVLYTSEEASSNNSSSSGSNMTAGRVLQLLTTKLKLTDVAPSRAQLVVVGSDDSETVISSNDDPLIARRNVGISNSKLFLRVPGQLDDIDVTAEVVSLYQEQHQVRKSQLRCKTCRTPLAASYGFIIHNPKTAGQSIPSRKGGSSSSSIPPSCMHYFVEPVNWMKPELEQGQLEGKLVCPKCKQKVGSYHWQGSKCSCGQWVTPAIKLQRNKVDEVLIPKAGL